MDAGAGLPASGLIMIPASHTGVSSEQQRDRNRDYDKMSLAHHATRGFHPPSGRALVSAVFAGGQDVTDLPIDISASRVAPVVTFTDQVRLATRAQAGRLPRR